MLIDFATLRQQVLDRLPLVSDLTLSWLDGRLHWTATTPYGVYCDTLPLSDAETMAEALYVAIGAYALPDSARASPDLLLLTQRIAARLPDVRGLVLTPLADGYVTYAYTCNGAVYASPGGARWLSGDLAVHIADLIAEKTRTRLLPEVILQGDTVVTLNGYSLRIAERQQVARAEARVDGQAYTVADAERDLGLVAEALCRESGYDDATAPMFVASALDLLARLRLTAFGAPQSSSGGRWLAAQHAATTNEQGQREPAVALDASPIGVDPYAKENARKPLTSAEVIALGNDPAIRDAVRSPRADTEPHRTWRHEVYEPADAILDRPADEEGR